MIMMRMMVDNFFITGQDRPLYWFVYMSYYYYFIFFYHVHLFLSFMYFGLLSRFCVWDCVG